MQAKATPLFNMQLFELLPLMFSLGNEVLGEANSYRVKSARSPVLGMTWESQNKDME